MSKQSVESEEDSFSKSGGVGARAPQYRRYAFLAALVTIGLFASLLAALLAPRATFSMIDREPKAIGPLRDADLDQAGTWVRTSGTPESTALSFERMGASGSYRLTRIKERPGVWLVLPVPNGFDETNFVPPSQFVGRLTPLASAGLSSRPLVRMIEKSEGTHSDDYLLFDGQSPRSERPALLAAFLLALLGAACLSFALHLCRKPRPVRPKS